MGKVKEMLMDMQEKEPVAICTYCRKKIFNDEDEESFEVRKFAQCAVCDYKKTLMNIGIIWKTDETIK